MADDDAPASEVSLEELARQMLGLDQEETEEQEFEEDGTEDQPTGQHPAWQEILNKIPPELHDQVIPTLQKWDAGVSRRFQKIHDEYAPYKDFEEYDPDSIREALGVYQALNNDPASTWETIGRVYGLSPQGSQANSSDEEDIDFDALPASIKNRLAKIDQHENVLEYMSQFVLDNQASAQEAQEDQELEELLEELAEEYGEFDEDYVVGLIAGGIDPEEAVGRFQQLTQQYQQAPAQREYPQVMSSGGGFPNMGQVDVNSLSSQDTQTLIAEMLRLSQDS